MADGNGKGRQEDGRQYQIILTFDPSTFALKVDGHTQNYDMALAMLQMATRWTEAQVRAESVKQALAGPRIAIPNRG